MSVSSYISWRRIIFWEESDCRLAVTLGAADKGAGRAERGLRRFCLLSKVTWLEFDSRNKWQNHSQRKGVCLLSCVRLCIYVPAHLSVRLRECIYVCLCVNNMRNRNYTFQFEQTSILSNNNSLLLFKYLHLFNASVCVCVCMCACVHACVGACVRACVCVNALSSPPGLTSQSSLRW